MCGAILAQDALTRHTIDLRHHGSETRRCGCLVAGLHRLQHFLNGRADSRAKRGIVRTAFDGLASALLC